eukprot:3428399-Rhodomonas_salina.1
MMPGAEIGCWNTRPMSAPTSRNPTQETAFSAQFVPGLRFPVFDFGVEQLIANAEEHATWSTTTKFPKPATPLRTPSTNNTRSQYRTSRSAYVGDSGVPYLVAPL